MRWLPLLALLPPLLAILPAASVAMTGQEPVSPQFLQAESADGSDKEAATAPLEGFAVATTASAKSPWRPVAEQASRDHGGAPIVQFKPDDLAALMADLKARGATWVQFVLPPDEIDVNFCFELLERSCCLDDDPFPDFVWGFVTGRTPDHALAFLAAIGRAASGEAPFEKSIFDNFGPTTQGLEGTDTQTWEFCWWAEMAASKYKLGSLSHGPDGIDPEKLSKLEGHGILHFGGHGIPERIEQGLTADQMRGLKLDGCYVFNGACSTGVTSRGFETWFGRNAREKRYPADDLFCLAALETGLAAYFAATHPDHGIPVYQEIEHLLLEGGDCGEIMKHTYDAVVLASDGKTPALPRFQKGRPHGIETGEEVMLFGTASRVLFGDPSLAPPVEPLGPAAEAELAEEGETLRLKVRLKKPEAKFTLQNTFRSDLCPEGVPFNDRICLRAEIPEGVAKITGLSVESATAGKASLKHELVAWAVEEWRGKRYLHVQVDFAPTGYQQSPMRSRKTRLSLLVEKE